MFHIHWKQREKKQELQKEVKNRFDWNLNLQGVIYMLFLISRMIYNKCNGRRSRRSWGPSSQTAKHWEHSCRFVTKTYGTDQECVSVLNHSDKPNEFPRSTGWVFVLFSERGPEFLSKSLQQWSVWKWSASFEMKGDGGYSVYAPPCRRN